jgi:aspartokinase-like uncharacterized kinase
MVTVGQKSAQTKIVVVKIGGASLFSAGAEFAQVHSFVENLKRDRTTRYFITLGGGDTVESMRTLHRNHPQLDMRKMHWRCVELLEGTSDVAAELLDLEVRIKSTDQLEHAIINPTPGCYLVDVSSFYNPGCIDWVPKGLVPAENWDTTSDTLAWLLALRIKASQLQLMKKPDCSKVQTIEQAAQLGIVDSQLAILSKKQPQDWKLDTLVVYHTNGWRKQLLTIDPFSENSANEQENYLGTIP